MTNQTKAVFDATASTYDVNRSRLIPGCDAFYRWAIDLIPKGAKEIVDLGAGSGLLSVLIRQRFPNAKLHLIDFSEPMLNQARTRMHGDPNVTFHQADYLTDPLPERVCAVVSALSIHHLENPDKQTLFTRIHATLKPNGTLVNADHIAGPTQELEDRYQATWLHQIRENGATEQQIQESLYRQQEDRRAPVNRQIAWMHTAGFADADCWYKDNCFAVMAGTKH